MSIFNPKMNLSERESAVPPPNNNANDKESNYSSDNSESDLDGECPAEPVNTGFASPGMIKDDHRIYHQSRYEYMYSWLYYSQSLHGYCAKFVRYIMVVHCVQQIRIMEPGPINRSPSMTMLVKRCSATIPQKVINKPFLVW